MKNPQTPPAGPRRENTSVQGDKDTQLHPWWQNERFRIQRPCPTAYEGDFPAGGSERFKALGGAQQLGSLRPGAHGSIDQSTQKDNISALCSRRQKADLPYQPDVSPPSQVVSWAAPAGTRGCAEETVLSLHLAKVCPVPCCSSHMASPDARGTADVSPSSPRTSFARLQWTSQAELKAHKSHSGDGQSCARENLSGPRHGTTSPSQQTTQRRKEAIVCDVSSGKGTSGGSRNPKLRAIASSASSKSPSC